MVREKILWLLLENSFRLCVANTLFYEPNLNSLTASSKVEHSNTYKFSTTNWSFLVHRILSPAYSLSKLAFVFLRLVSPLTLLGFKRSKTFSL